MQLQVVVLLQPVFLLHRQVLKHLATVAGPGTAVVTLLQQSRHFVMVPGANPVIQMQMPAFLHRY